MPTALQKAASTKLHSTQVELDDGPNLVPEHAVDPYEVDRHRPDRPSAVTPHAASDRLKFRPLRRDATYGAQN